MEKRWRRRESNPSVTLFRTSPCTVFANLRPVWFRPGPPDPAPRGSHMAAATKYPSSNPSPPVTGPSCPVRDGDHAHTAATPLLKSPLQLHSPRGIDFGAIGCMRAHLNHMVESALRNETNSCRLLAAFEDFAVRQPCGDAGERFDSWGLLVLTIVAVTVTAVDGEGLSPLFPTR